MSLLLDELGLEPALQEMSDSAVAAVEGAGIATVEKLHGGGEIGPRRLDEEMVMIGHQDEGVQAPAVVLHRASEPLQPLLAVAIIAHDRSAFIAARHDMVEGTRELDAKRSCHGPNVTGMGSRWQALITNQALTPSFLSPSFR